MPALAPRRPVLEAAVDDVVADCRFPARFHAGAEAMHRGLFDGADVATLAPGAGAELRAAVAARSRAARCSRPVTRSCCDSAAGGSRRARPRRAVGAPARLLGPSRCSPPLALLVAAALRAPTRRRGARRVALGLALAGGAIVAATTIGRAIVLSTFDTSHGDAVVGRSGTPTSASSGSGASSPGPSG